MTEHVDPRIEPAARALYEYDRNASCSPDRWPDWDSPDNNGREIGRDMATAAIAAADKAATITTVAELDALPIQSIVACMGIAPGTRNIPVTLVWQRGSVDNGGSDWCMPDTRGQITSTDVFYFLNVNQLLQELTVLHRGTE